MYLSLATVGTIFLMGVNVGTFMNTQYFRPKLDKLEKELEIMRRMHIKK